MPLISWITMVVKLKPFPAVETQRVFFLNTDIANLIPRIDCVKDLTVFIDLKLYFHHYIVYVIFHSNRALSPLPTVILFFFRFWYFICISFAYIRLYVCLDGWCKTWTSIDELCICSLYSFFLTRAIIMLMQINF